MWSKTAETNPSPSATRHAASGSLCTGIIDAARTSDSRKMLPRMAAGSSPHAGLRSGTHTSNATHTAAPMNGQVSEISLKRTLITTFDHDRSDQNQRYDEHSHPIDHDAGDWLLGDRRVALLLQSGRDPENEHRRASPNIRFEHLQRVPAIDPHHGRRRVADDA